MDPFTLLGIEPSFEVDLPTLERRYRDISASLHPDRYSGHPASERREALGRAIAVNEAWRTLKNPITRAEALLRHLKAPDAPDETAANAPVDVPGASAPPPSARPSEPPPAPAFLMQILELREKLTDLRASRNLGALRALRARVAGDEQKTSAQLSAAFQALELDEAERVLGELRYYRRFLDEADALEDELD
jgi:molecular chaperone HscB